MGALIGLLLIFRDQQTQGATASTWPTWLVLLSSFLSAILGSSVFYIRKLYKLGFRQEPLAAATAVRDFAAIAYFLSRPLFSCAFAFLVVISLRAENQFVSPGGDVDEANFAYVSMFLSFLCGFAAGKVITTLERKGSPIHD